MKLLTHSRKSGSKIHFGVSLNRRQFIALAAPPALSLLKGCNKVEQQFESSSDLQSLLNRAVKDAKLPGVTAAMVHGERLLWSGAAGFADLDKGIKMSVDHILNIGSISKTITATAA